MDNRPQMWRRTNLSE